MPPTGFLVAVGVDILVDGVLLGVGFAVGTAQGRLLALALALELFSLGMVTAAQLAQAGQARARVLGTTAGLGLTLLVGAAAGATIFAQVSPHALALVLAFALAALLFLVTEELLVEAHETPEMPVITATFFAGFCSSLCSVW